MKTVYSFQETFYWNKTFIGLRVKREDLIDEHS